MRRGTRRGFKKLISFLLVVVMIMGMLPADLALAESSPSPEPTVTEESTPEATTEASETTGQTQESSESPEPGETPETTPESTESPEPTESSPATYDNSISGMLWLDMFDDIENSIYAGDGIRQAEESPLAGYRVELYKADDMDNAIASTTTGADGKYSFENIEPGSYVVGVKTTTMDGVEYLLPLFWLDGTTGDNRFVATYDETTDAYLYAYTVPITVAEDTVVTGMDAGMRTVPEAQTLEGSYDAEINLADGTYTGDITGINITGGAVQFTTSITGNNYRIYGTTSARRVVLQTNVDTNITLDGVSISSSNFSPFSLNGTAKVNLTLTGTNVLTCTHFNSYGTSGYAGLCVGASATLTIDGSGSLQATGGLGAGIGGNYSMSNGTVIINGGTITANGGSGSAGIGGGRGVDTNGGSGGTITINGGTVAANGNFGGAGIGGGYASSSSGSYVAGNGGTITINGGTITATGGIRSPGIGGGGAFITGNTGGSSGIITITGGRITTTGGGKNGVNDSGYAGGIGGALGGNGESRNTAGTIIFTGGSILPRTNTGTVSVIPSPTNGTVNGGDVVTMQTIPSSVSGKTAGQKFVIEAIGSLQTYLYPMLIHHDGTDNAYPWAPYNLLAPEGVTNAATSVSTITATLNGTYNTKSLDGDVYYEYGTTSGSYTSTASYSSSANSTSDASAPKDITGLTPNTTYYYRIVVESDGGPTSYGAEMSFTTGREVTVTFDPNGGTVGTTSGTYASTETFGTLPTPTLAGYDFVGWYDTSATTGGTQATSSTAVGDLFSGTTGTLYARWTENSYTVAFDSHGGTTTPGSMTRTYTQQMGTLTSVSQPGYTFNGWYTAASGGTQVSATSTISVLSPTLASGATLTLHAQWTVNNNTVTFDTQGGSTAPADLSITAVTALGTLATPTRTGYDFAGWWTTASTGGTQANAASTPIGLDSTLAADATLTLYARWTARSYQIDVKYETRSGGSVTGKTNFNVPAAYDSTYAPSASETAAPTGYAFVGWKLDGGAIQTGTPSITVSGNATITLVYGLDRGKTDDDPTDSGTTPDGIEDIIVTKQWYDTVGGVYMRTSKQVVVNVGDTFDDIYDLITGYTYKGYRIDGGTLQTANQPNITVAGGDSDFTITYEYERQSFMLGVAFKLRSGVDVPGMTGFNRNVSYGVTYSPQSSEMLVANYVLVDWSLDDGATLVGNTNPSITVLGDGITITLIYGKDNGGGGTLIPGGDGIEDFNVTRIWEMSDGSAITGLNGITRPWNVGETFTKAHSDDVSIPTGLTYQGYRLSTDAAGDPLHAGTPGYTVNTTDGDVIVTYVYSKTQYQMTVHFVNRAGTPIGSPTTTTAQVDHGDPYTATAPTISGYTFVDWKVGSTGTLAGNTTPTISSITAATELYLVYGRDRGTTGDISGGGGETPNSKEDFDVTRLWQMQGGGSISGLGGQIVIVDVGDAFTTAHNSGVTIPAGLTYEGYYLSSDGGTTLHTGTPNYTVNVTDGNVTVTYVYSTNQYTVTVNYQDRAGTQLQAPAAGTVAYGQNYTPADPGFANKVLVGWYTGAPVSNPTVLNLPATLTNVTGNAEITLVYGKDNVKADDTAGTDGVEDFTVTKKWETTTGTTLNASINKDLNVGKVFNTAHNVDVNLASSGWTYQGYYLSSDGGTTLHTGVPNVAVTAARGDFTVTYVYARTTFTMTVNFVDRGAVTQQPSSNPGAVYGDPFRITSPPVITGKIYVGWYLGAPSASKTVLTTTPEINPVTGAGEITLVYGKNNGGGGTTTPDSLEDFDVKREWKMQDGTAITGLPAVTEPWNVTETFAKAHDTGVTIPAGLTYLGYKYDTDAAGDAVRTGTPSIIITVAGGDRGVTYYYSTTNYTINVTYEYQNNSGTASSLPGSQAAGILHGGSFNTTSTPALLIPDYPSASSTTDAAFRYKTYIGYKLDGGLMQTGAPGLTNITAGHTIVLVYGQDMNENGTRDYTVSETHKSGSTTLATNTVYVDESQTYSGSSSASVIASGYDYTGYTIDGTTTGTTATVSIPNVTADHAVVYEYSTRAYTVTVNYEYRKNDSTTTSLGSKTYSVDHGDNLDTTTTPALEVPDYTTNPATYAAFRYVTFSDWDNGSGLQGNTSPGLTNITGSMTLTFVYVQDMDEDGVHDYTVTEKFQTEAGGTILADNKVYVNASGTYSMTDPDTVLPTGSGTYYTKYQLDGGADSATAVKPVTISTVTADHTVIYKYLPNDYVVNVVYEYHKNDGTVQVLGTGQTASITHGNAFDASSTPALAQPTFTGVTYDGWKLGGVTQTGTPGIVSVTNAATITLVYVQDMDGNGVRDYTVTERHITPNTADNKTYDRYINVGTSYSASTDSTVTGNGYTYTDYAVTNSSTVTGLAPALPGIAAVNSEYTVTLNYARTLYTVNVTYQYRANNGTVTTLPGSQSVHIAHGGSFDTTTPTGNELVIPDYLAAPGTTDPAFQYKTFASWKLDNVTQTGALGLTNVTGAHNLVLVYAQDMDGNGTPDITVTKQFINGHTSSTLKAEYDVYVNVGSLFSGGADTISGWTYDHHIIDGGTPSVQYALPSFTPALGDANKVVAYVYYDITPPAAPVIDPVGDSDTIVTGTGDEIGNTITLTWPDGSTGTATVQTDYTWEMNVPGTVTLAEYDVLSATETDPYNNTSTSGTTTVYDNTPPAAPVINPVGTSDTTVTGTGDEPGNTITLTWPDGTTGTATVQLDYTWSVSVPSTVTLAESDVLSATETDLSSNESGPGTTTVYDNTAPAAPVIDPVGDSDTIVTGTGDEIGNVITVTWPDGTTGTTTVKPDGTWEIDVPGTVTLDEGDVITATETDTNNNESGPGTTTVYDNTPPAAPVIDPVEETDTKVTGTGDEPGNTITVTWPDGSTDTTIVKPDGTWEVNVPGGITLNPNDTITAKETDQSYNDSSPGNAIVGVTTYLASVSYEYHANDGSVVTLPGNQAVQVAHNTGFTASIPDASTHPAFDQKVLIGWTLDGAMQTGTPQISNMTQAHNIVLLFAQDMDRDGTPDITVTKEFLRADGTTLKPSQTVYVNQGGTFTDPHDVITGYDYQGFKLNGGSTQTGEPDLLVGAISRAATVIYNNTTVSYIYTATQYTVTVKVVDENGNSINNGSYDWTASKSYQESFTAVPPTVQGYSYQSWKLDGTQQSGDVRIGSVEAAAAILLVYKAAPTEEPDYGNYDFIKKPNVKNVAAGQKVVYTFTGFGNKWPVSLEKYTISDKPDKGLDFVSAELPAFTNGAGITYDIVYFTNLNGKQVLHAGVPADKAFSFTAPALKSGEYITALTLDFGTVPAGFAVGDTMKMTFKVWDNPPSQTLTNIGILSYKVNGKDREFVTGSGTGTITIDGYFNAPKTGDDTNRMISLSLLGASLLGILALTAAKKRKKRRTA